MSKHRHVFRVARPAVWLFPFLALFPNVAQATPFTPEIFYFLIFEVFFLIFWVFIIFLVGSEKNSVVRKWLWVFVFIYPAHLVCFYLFSVFLGLYEESADNRFRAMCGKHEPQAVRIFEVAKESRPKSYFVPEIYRSAMRGHFLIDCMRDKEPACSNLGVSFVEYSEYSYVISEESGGVSVVCKLGLETKLPHEKGQCRPEYNRVNFVSDPDLRKYSQYTYDSWSFKEPSYTTKIEKPVSDYVIRFGRMTLSDKYVFMFERAKKGVVTIESAKTGKIYAMVEILSRKNSIPGFCPIPEETIPEMIRKVFPRS